MFNLNDKARPAHKPRLNPCAQQDDVLSDCGDVRVDCQWHDVESSVVPPCVVASPTSEANLDPISSLKIKHISHMSHFLFIYRYGT